MDRRHFLGSVLGLAAATVAAPLIKPRSFFFFGRSYRLDQALIKWKVLPPLPDQDTGRILYATVHLPHVKHGKLYSGFYSVTHHFTEEESKSAKTRLYNLLDGFYQDKEQEYTLPPCPLAIWES